MKHYLLIKHQGKFVQMVFPNVEDALEYSYYISMNKGVNPGPPSNIPDKRYPIINSV